MLSWVFILYRKISVLSSLLIFADKTLSLSWVRGWGRWGPVCAWAGRRLMRDWQCETVRPVRSRRPETGEWRVACPEETGDRGDRPGSSHWTQKCITISICKRETKNAQQHLTVTGELVKVNQDEVSLLFLFSMIRTGNPMWAVSLVRAW